MNGKLSGGAEDQDMHQLAGEIRAMLLRRADDVRPQRPEWHSLDGPQVGFSPPTRGLTGPRKPSWTRPVTAAASVLVIVLVAVVAVDRMGNGTSGTDEDTPAGESGGDSDVWPDRPPDDAWPEVPAPGSVDFDPALATPVHPVIDEADLAELSPAEREVLFDPVEAARDYLASVGIEEGVGRVAELKVDIAADEDGVSADPATTDTLVVSWSTWEEEAPAVSSGHVYLRRSYAALADDYGESGDSGEPREPWIVVGARTQGISVAGVRRTEDTIVFGIDRTADETGVEHLSVEVDGEVLAGEVPDGARDTLTVRAAAEEPVRLRFQHVEPAPISVFEITVPALGTDYADLTE